jgi:hypothetical protein
MSEVVIIRLSELRDSAEQLRQSSRHIEQSLQHVSDIIRELTVLGMEEHHLQTLGNPPILRMNNWTHKLNQFAERLDNAADDIDNAVNHELRLIPHFDLSLLPEHELVTIEAPKELPIVNTGGWYVSSSNKSLYLNWQEQQKALTEQQSELGSLVEQRQLMIDELQATRNRALSHDANINLNEVPRVQALQTEIAKLDTAITQHDASIVNLKTKLEALSTRLDMVQPGHDADLHIIRQMDGAATHPYVLSHTYDCVNHIVQKLPIPNEMALDAYMWNDLVLSHPEYGITIGKQPLEGAVIVLEREHSYADNAFGHLFYVEKVHDGAIWVTDNDHALPIRLTELTNETSGDYINYLYFPWHTHA